MGPALREDRDGVDVGSQQCLEAVDDPAQRIPFRKLLSALRLQVGDVDIADAGVKPKEECQFPGELPSTNKSDRDHDNLPSGSFGRVSARATD